MKSVQLSLFTLMHVGFDFGDEWLAYYPVYRWVSWDGVVLGTMYGKLVPYAAS